MENSEERGAETPQSGFKGRGIGVDDTSIAFRPKNWEEIWNFAQLIAKTDFVPKPFQNNPGSILAAIQTGHELGLPPMASLQSIAVINGRPSVWGEGALALLKHDRDFEWIKELPPDECEVREMGECVVKMRGQPEVVRRFTKAMAERAKLLSKEGPWQTYRGRMYQMRSRAWAIRDAAPGALRGVGIREEMQDIDIEESDIRREQPEPPIGIPHVKQEAQQAEPEKKKGRPAGSKNRAKETASEPRNVEPGEDTQTPTGNDNLSAGNGAGTEETQATDQAQAKPAEPQPPKPKSWQDETLGWKERIELWIEQVSDQEIGQPRNFLGMNIDKVKDSLDKVALVRKYDVRLKAQ